MIYKGLLKIHGHKVLQLLAENKNKCFISDSFSSCAKTSIREQFAFMSVSESVPFIYSRHISKYTVLIWVWCVVFVIGVCERVYAYMQERAWYTQDGSHNSTCDIHHTPMLSQWITTLKNSPVIQFFSVYRKELRNLHNVLIKNAKDDLYYLMNMMITTLAVP